jgi:arginyl-tRNA synthetase
MTVRADIEQLLRQALDAVAETEGWAAAAETRAELERTRDARHGDLTTSIAMRIAKPLGVSSRDVAARIVAALPSSDLIEATEIAGPGFINFTLPLVAYHRALVAALEQGETFGSSLAGAGRRVLLEFVSANPTGPLHVGHGRHAAYGATLGNLLRATGHRVDEEYYVNDAGRQMDILALSVWLRYLELCGHEIEFPGNCYQGQYCREIAAEIRASHDGADLLPNDSKLDDALRHEDHDSERRLDLLIAIAKRELGDRGFFEEAIESILADIKGDLAEFGVSYDCWFSERSLSESGAIDAALAALGQRGLLYRAAGATWFRTTDFDDDKDRVVVRENAAKTYFASDIAYHKNKCDRGYDLLINVLGSDHHGYVARLRAALRALGEPDGELDVRLVQFVVLYRGQKKVQMTTRGGTYVTLRELRSEVGNDAARFFYVSRSNDQHLDFDLELAKTQSSDNPVYYVQYAHARIASMLSKLREQGYLLPDASLEAVSSLTDPTERSLIGQVSRFPEVVELAASNRAPQLVVQYVRELAAEFHSYYNAQRIIVDNAALRDARVLLSMTVQHVLRRGLHLLGVSAPDTM